MVTRIRQLLTWQQLSPTQFADLIGVGRPVISHILSERNKPSLDVVQRIIAAFPTVSLSWLLSGAGEMVVSASLPGQEQVESPPLAPASPLTEAIAVKAPAIASASPPVAPPLPTLAAQVPPAKRYSPVPKAVPPLARFIVAKPNPVEASDSLAAPALAAAEPLLAVGPVPLAQPPSLSEPATETVAPAPPAAPKMGSTVPPATPEPSVEGGALVPFLAEPGKVIRRIVIFYRDGSFADYSPEA